MQPDVAVESLKEIHSSGIWVEENKLYNNTKGPAIIANVKPSV